MRRLLAPLGLLLVTVLAVGCSDDGSKDSSNASSAAMTVNSTKIPVDELVGELRTLAANPELARFLKEQDEKLVPKPDTIDPDLTQSYVTIVAQQVLIDEELARRNLEVDPDGRAAAAQKVAEIFYGQKIFRAFPQEFRDLQVERQMRIEALQAALGPKATPTEADLQELFGRVQEQCASGKAVSQIWTKAKADADRIAAELAQGADFATLARERSENETTAERGGLLTCVGAAQYNGYPADFRGAAESLAVGEISAPFASDDGYTMLKILPLTYEVMRPLLIQEFDRRQLSPLAAYLTEAMKQAKPFKVQKRFGKVVRTDSFTAITPRFAPVDLSD